jgi:hypothetical protein
MASTTFSGPVTSAQRRQMEANLNAIAGAMQECQFWLSKLQTPEIQDGKSTV